MFLVEVVVANGQWATYNQCVGVEESKELSCASLSVSAETKDKKSELCAF